MIADYIVLPSLTGSLIGVLAGLLFLRWRLNKEKKLSSYSITQHGDVVLVLSRKEARSLDVFAGLGRAALDENPDIMAPSFGSREDIEAGIRARESLSRAVESASDKAKRGRNA
jgi:hypothetical protein